MIRGDTERVAPPGAGRNAMRVRLMAILLGLSIGLLLGETGARVFAKFGGRAGQRLAIRDPLGIIYEPFGHSGYRQKPGSVEQFPNGTRANYNRMAYRGPLVSVPKPPGVQRVVLLGGSTTVGYGVNDNYTIDAFMRRILRTRDPDACYEVVNLGLGGYDSYQDYERMRVDGTRLTPDLVIIHSGINDVRNAQFADLEQPPDARTLIWEGEMRRMRERQSVLARARALILHYSYLARLPGMVMEGATQHAGLRVIQVVEPHDDAIGYFSTNVERTIELALAVGARVLLSKPPSAIPIRNAPSDPVEKSYWIKDAATTEKYRERLAGRMREIAQRYREAGDPVDYVSHELELGQYIDDAHLNAAGNQAVAEHLVDAALELIAQRSPKSTAGGQSCAP